MTWPTDDLTKVHLDSGTDSPSNARAELEALVDKVKLILAEVDSGATVWHSGNDGSTSTLDADLLDGQEGSYYRDASNLNAGTVPLARLPAGAGTGLNADLLDSLQGSYYLDLANHTGAVNSTQIGADQVGQSEIGTAQVGQTELKTASAEQSMLIDSSGGNLTLSHGEYSFAAEFRVSTGGAFIWGAGGSNFVRMTNTAYNGLYIRAQKEGSGSSTFYAKSRYVTASPPHKIGALDFGPFLFLIVDKNKNIVRTSLADDPSWYFKGPTNIRPDRVAKGGKKYKKVRILPENFDSLPRHLQFIAKAKAPIEEIEIDFEYKNKDMPLYPHPFTHGELEEGQSVLIIEPDDKVYSDIISLREQGESIAELLHEGYLKIGPESKSHDCPPGVCMHKIKWSNLK